MITEKGQVTIPKRLRDQLGMLPGSEVEFEADGETLVVRKAMAGPTRGERLIARLRGRAEVRMTTDEIMALTREAGVDR
jgi:AbrB family looped-hinge helix DNA binding protein